MQANYVQRLRVTFGKHGPTRWIGHLDLARTWERALNRSKIPVAYTQGFNRRPRMQFASALPLGYTSDCEYLDLWLGEAMPPEQALQQLREKMAPGIDVHQVQEVELRQPSLPTLVEAAVYEARLVYGNYQAEALQQRIDAFLAAEEIIAEKRGRKKSKRYNLRPLVYDIRLQPGDPLLLELHVSASEGRSGRPGDILRMLDINPEDAHIARRQLTLTAEAE